MAVNTHRTVSNAICSQGMVGCVLGVFLDNSETARKLGFEDGNRVLMIKAVFSTWGSWIITASDLPEKHTFLFITTAVV